MKTEQVRENSNTRACPSIVMPLFNNKELVAEMIDSILVNQQIAAS